MAAGKPRKKKEKKKKQRQCANCKRWFDHLSALGVDICHDCYADNWDRSFSSQADYSDKMLEEEGDVLRKHARRLNKANVNIKELDWFFKHCRPGIISCAKCGRERLRWDRSLENMRAATREKYIGRLSEPCPGCGVVGFLDGDGRTEDVD